MSASFLLLTGLTLIVGRSNDVMLMSSWSAIWFLTNSTASLVSRLGLFWCFPRCSGVAVCCPAVTCWLAWLTVSHCYAQCHGNYKMLNCTHGVDHHLMRYSMHRTNCMAVLQKLKPSLACKPVLNQTNMHFCIMLYWVVCFKNTFAVLWGYIVAFQSTIVFA